MLRATASLAVLAGALFLVSATGCGASAGRHGARPPPGRVTAGAARLVARGVPTTASVSSGPERCFDARDDNGNGLVDEGCGTRTGLVGFMIAWDAPTADVDLLVTDPKGELVEVGRPSTAGLVKDRDCPGRRQECRGKNFENVYLDRDDASRGTYRVRIRLERLEDEDAPVRVTFGARVGPKSYGEELELERPEDERRLEFEL